jgi:hypothetical protein
MSDSNMNNFATDSYNLEGSGNSWSVKPGSIYTNKNANFNYFSNTSGDPYTYYAFWYRKFPNQNSYLNCYHLPYPDVYLKNSYGYVKGSNQCTTPLNNNRYNVSSGGFKFYE